MRDAFGDSVIDVAESTVKYHLFFVVHTEDDEIEGLRGIWSISLADDDLYQQKNFAFGAAPTASQQEDGESIAEEMEVLLRQNSAR